MARSGDMIPFTLKIGLKRHRLRRHRKVFRIDLGDREQTSDHGQTKSTPMSEAHEIGADLALLAHFLRQPASLVLTALLRPSANMTRPTPQARGKSICQQRTVVPA
jgi:hypothetical protein